MGAACCFISINITVFSLAICVWCCAAPLLLNIIIQISIWSQISLIAITMAVSATGVAEIGRAHV